MVVFLHVSNFWLLLSRLQQIPWVLRWGSGSQRRKLSRLHGQNNFRNILFGKTIVNCILVYVLPFIRLGHPATPCTKVFHPTYVATQTRHQGHGIEKHLEFTIMPIFQFWWLWEVKGQQSISGATLQPQEIMSFVQGLVALKVKGILSGMQHVVVWKNTN